jgi:hypothetical protein
MGAFLARAIEVVRTLIRIADLARQIRELSNALKAAFDAVRRILNGDDPLEA